MDEDRNVEIGHQFEEWPRNFRVWILALVTGIDDDGAGVVIFDGAFEFFEEFVTPARDAGRHRDELVGMLVATVCKITIGTLDRSNRFLHGLHMPDVMHRIADDGAV